MIDQCLADGGEVSHMYRYGVDAAQSNPALADTLLGRTCKTTGPDGIDSYFSADYNCDYVWDFLTTASTMEGGTAMPRVTWKLPLLANVA